MSDDLWKREDIESPCIQVCLIHPDAGICLGCHRTGEEITLWSQMTPEERGRIMAELPDRKSRLPGRRGGRKARLRR